MKSKIAFLFFSLLTACALGGASDKRLAHSFKGGSIHFSFVRGGQEVNIPVRTNVTSWVINCMRTRAIAWGQIQDEQIMGDLPYSQVYLLDLHHDKVISGFKVARGPYDAVFSRDQKFLSVDDQVVDLDSGKVVGMTEDVEITSESCPSFSGKTSGP